MDLLLRRPAAARTLDRVLETVAGPFLYKYYLLTFGVLLRCCNSFFSRAVVESGMK